MQEDDKFIDSDDDEIDESYWEDEVTDPHMARLLQEADERDAFNDRLNMYRNEY